MAGAFISFGCLLMTSVGGNMPLLMGTNHGLYRLIYASVFPFGLMMVILSGAELYTGNTALVTMSHLEGKISFGEVSEQQISLTHLCRSVLISLYSF